MEERWRVILLAFAPREDVLHKFSARIRCSDGQELDVLMSPVEFHELLAGIGLETSEKWRYSDMVRLTEQCASRSLSVGVRRDRTGAVVGVRVP